MSDIVMKIIWTIAIVIILFLLIRIRKWFREIPVRRAGKVGKLVGKEDDFEWKKYKLSAGGKVYEKNVKNPIKQVKRQVYILSHYLKSYGIDIWVEGYALLVENNSPVHGECVLESRKEIGTVIHRQGRNHLSKKTMEEVRNLLK